MHNRSRGIGVSRTGASLVGRRLGVYHIQALVGSGGMGEVYRAHDSRLGRDVALKVLPAAFIADSDRLARFEREARVLAALNHPHVGAIYGLEEGDGIRALVLELLDGDTLAERIASGPVAVDQALGIAEQIAQALDAAHEKGIVHRDLKPANVKITPDGVVKVLDFGLAKTTGSGPSALTEAPTMTAGGTREGIVLGTAAYMSPEQARGQAVDKRTDVWAFACVLYEMLTGRRPFAGPTVSDTMAAILEREPDWAALPSDAPAAVGRLLRRCFAKDPRQRVRDIGDVRLELLDVQLSQTPASPQVGTARRGHRNWWIAGAVMALVAVALGYDVATRPRADPLVTAPMQFAVELPPAAPQLNRGLGNRVMALSPDGSHLAFMARRAGEASQLWVHSLARFESQPLAGTVSASAPFFSPDSRWIGFFQGGQIKKVLVSGGGEPLVICDLQTTDSAGAHWASDDTIFFTPSIQSGLWRVSAAGGVASAVLTDDDVEYRWPQVLPGGEVVVFTSRDSEHPEGPDRVYAQVLRSGQRHTIVEGTGGFVADRHLVFVRGSTVLAAPFDLRSLRTTGEPLPLIDRVSPATSALPVSLSDTGSLAYVPALGRPEGGLAWVAHNGSEQPITAPVRPYGQPRLAPDGRLLVVVIETFIGSESNLWTYDLVRDVLAPFTSGGRSAFPVWTPDGRRLTYHVAPAMVSKSADGGGSEDRLLNGGLPMSWAPDGRTLAFVRIDQATQTDIWLLPFDSAGKPGEPRPAVQSRSREGGAVFSPDGRWFAYVSNETGRNEVYVRSAAEDRGRQQLSTGGGNEPVWPRHAGQLFYRNGDVMMVVDVSTEPTLSAGKPRPLFKGQYAPSTALWANYDVTADGQKFLMIKPVAASHARSQAIHLVLNWAEALKRRAAANP
jgi:Tol biopolymer transport system component